MINVFVENGYDERILRQLSRKYKARFKHLMNYHLAETTMKDQRLYFHGYQEYHPNYEKHTSKLGTKWP